MTHFYTTTQLWGHQQAALDFIWRKKAAMLYMGMGTGKSKVVVDYAVNLQAKKVLILCPLAVCTAWEKQFGMHAPDAYQMALLNGPKERGGPFKGSTARRAAALNHWLPKDYNGGGKVVVINYEAAWRTDMAKVLMARQWDLLVYDESHKIKAPGGKASRFCYRLRQKANRILALTGTPIPNNPMDLYGQFRALDPYLFGVSFVNYRNKYAVMGGYEGRQVVGFQNQEDMNEKFYRLTFRADRDVLDLPEATTVEMVFELSGEAARIYKGIEDDFIADIGDGVITVSNALVKLLKLQQITSGFIRDEEGKDIHVHKGKMKLLQDVVEQTAGEPLVVFCRFKHDLAAVHKAAEAAGVTSLELSGERRELERWQDGEAVILAAQIQSGGIGIDLTRARYCAFYSMGFSLGEYEQALARIHRPGQEKPCTFIHMVCEGTVDRKVLKALANKRDVIETVLGDYKQQAFGGRYESDSSSSLF